MFGAGSSAKVKPETTARTVPMRAVVDQRHHARGQRLMAIHEALFDDDARRRGGRGDAIDVRADRARAAFRTARACRRRSRRSVHGT